MDDSLPELGDLEREVMQLVWANGPVTAEAVRERLSRPLKESTVRTVSSIAALGMPIWFAMSFTRRSTRSMNGAPLATARAAEDGFSRLSAALAYFSNGT